MAVMPAGWANMLWPGLGLVLALGLDLGLVYPYRNTGSQHRI